MYVYVHSWATSSQANSLLHGTTAVRGGSEMDILSVMTKGRALWKPLKNNIEMDYPELIFLHPFMDILIRCGLICEQQRSRCAV